MIQKYIIDDLLVHFNRIATYNVHPQELSNDLRTYNYNAHF